MNWYIFAIVVLTGVAIVACITAHAWGKETGRKEGYQSSVNDTSAKSMERARIAYANGERKGFQLGIDHWKRIIADRAREAARRDGKGRFAKGSAK